MRLFIIKAILSGLALGVQAHTPGTTTMMSKGDSVRYERYKQRLDRYQRSWQKLIPKQYTTQYAGSIGLMSVGLGWFYGSNSQWETDIMLGYLPQYDTDHAKSTLTIKESYSPWRLALSEQWAIVPFTCGLFVNTVFSEDFWTSEPRRYPNGYYNFNLRMRIHVGFGQRLTWEIPQSKRLLCKSISVYYEISTCDLYVISAVQNKHLKFNDVISLGFGLKARIF